MYSKSLMDIILNSSLIHQEYPPWIRTDSWKWPDLLLETFQLQRNVIYQFVCTLQDKSNGMIEVAYGHHPWNQAGPPWTRKGSWMMTRSTFCQFFLLQRSVIYPFVCMLQDKYNDVVKITYGHHPWCHEDPPWTSKSSWRMTRSTIVKFWATEKCDLLICMYFARQIQWYDQNYLWTPSLELGWSFMDLEGFLKDD